MSYSVHNNKTATTSWLKASPYSQKTREDASKGKLSPVVRTFVKATETPLRILGTGFFGAALPLMGIKAFGGSSDDSGLKSWKTLGIILLGGGSAFIADSSISGKPKADEETEELQTPEVASVNKASNKNVIIREAGENVVRNLFKNLSEVGVTDFATFQASLADEPWQILRLGIDKSQIKNHFETPFNNDKVIPITENVVIEGKTLKIGIRISCEDIQKALNSKNNEFKFDILEDDVNMALSSVNTSLYKIGYVAQRVKKEEELAAA